MPNGEFLMDARNDGRAYGMYDHEMRMEYEEDEQGDPAVDEFGQCVVTGADPWTPVRPITGDLRRWVNLQSVRTLMRVMSLRRHPTIGGGGQTHTPSDWEGDSSPAIM